MGCWAVGAARVAPVAPCSSVLCSLAAVVAVLFFVAPRVSCFVSFPPPRGARRSPAKGMPSRSSPARTNKEKHGSV